MAEHKVHHKKSSSMAITAVASVVFLVIGIGIGYVLFTPAATVIEKSSVGNQVVDFINDNIVQEGTAATLGSVEEENGLLKITATYQGSEANIYSTTDGSMIFLSQPIPTDTPVEKPEPTTPAPTSVPKSDKPEVELFVMSHCPYGTQAEKGILPAVRELGDKIDFKLRFVYYAMHPNAGEVEEQLAQYCIQKEQPDLFLDYLACFLKDSDSARCLEETGVDTDMLATCYAAADEEFDITANLEDTESWLSERFPLFNTDKTLNEKYGVGSSPTLIINGAKSNAGRSSASYLAGICAAFNNPPAECETELSAQSPGPGFGYDSVAAATAAGCAV